MDNNEKEDWKEFADSSEQYEEDSGSSKRPTQARALDDSEEESKEKSVGKLTQYAYYGRGFKATSGTIGALPSGVYDIVQDNHGTYVVPTLPPTGLLLELPEMRSDYVIKLIEKFWASEADYKEGNEFVIGGAAYKAGILLFGAPGSGKSSTIKILCKKLIEKNGTVFNASSHPSIISSFLNEFATVEPNRKCIVIFEDIDSLISNYGEQQYLEILDSAKTIDNVLFIATTNYPDRLDPRIWNRPGRFSNVVKVGMPTRAAREAYLKAVLKNHRDVEYIVNNTEGFSVDHLASLVNSCYREKKDLKEEIERLRTLFKVPKSDESKSIGFAK